jgi:hypothetical protein
MYKNKLLLTQVAHRPYGELMYKKNSFSHRWHTDLMGSLFIKRNTYYGSNTKTDSIKMGFALESRSKLKMGHIVFLHARKRRSTHSIFHRAHC